MQCWESVSDEIETQKNQLIQLKEGSYNDKKQSLRDSTIIKKGCNNYNLCYATNKSSKTHKGKD